MFLSTLIPVSFHCKKCIHYFVIAFNFILCTNSNFSIVHFKNKKDFKVVSLFHKFYILFGLSSKKTQFDHRGLLYKVAPPEIKISPIMYFVIYNSVVLSRILKIVVPVKQNFENSIFTL